MREWLPAHPLAAAALASAAAWTAFFAAFEPFYATNDDPLIGMIASGTGFTSVPDAHLVFTNVLVGRVLKLLYQWWSHLPWYGLYLLATHVLAHTALFWAALRIAGGGRTFALCAMYFVVAAIPFANNLQFTTAAFVAAQAGLLLGLSLLVRPAARRRASLGTAAAAIALATLGSLIRFEAFLLALALVIPPALVLAWRRGFAVVRPAGAVLAASLLLAVGARAYDGAVYARHPAWAAYREFNDVLREFVDYGRAATYGPQTAAVFRQVGWSQNDQRLFAHWFHPDADVFSTARMRQVLAAAPAADRPAGERLGEGLRRVARNRTALPLLLVWPLALGVTAHARSRWAILASVLASLAVLAFLLVFRKAPPHVSLAALSFPPALALVLERDRPRGRAGRTLLALAAVLAAGAALRALSFQRAESGDAGRLRAAFAPALSVLRGSADRVYVTWATFPFGIFRPLADPRAEPGFRFVALGWPQRTPVAQAELAARGLPGLVQLLATDPRVRLIAPPEVAPWVERYVHRHRGARVTLVPETSFPGLAVFRVGPGAAEPASGTGQEHDEGGTPAPGMLESAPAVQE